MVRGRMLNIVKVMRTGGGGFEMRNLLIEIVTCPKEDLLEIESQAQNSYIHNGKLTFF